MIRASALLLMSGLLMAQAPVKPAPKPVPAPVKPEPKPAPKPVKPEPKPTPKPVKPEPKAAPAKVSPAKPAPAETVWIGHKDSKILHKGDCKLVARMKPENKVTFKSREEGEKAGYRMCKACGACK